MSAGLVDLLLFGGYHMRCVGKRFIKVRHYLLFKRLKHYGIG